MASQYQIERADTGPTSDRTRAHSDFHIEGVGDLQRSTPSPEALAAATRYVAAHAPDLLEMLGLAAPASTGGCAPIDVACPDCGTPAGSRCVTGAGGTYYKFHIGRVRLAAAGSSALQEA